VRPGESLAGQSVEIARRKLTARFASAAISSPELDARLLIGAVLGLDLTGVITAANRTLSPDQSTRIENFARRRLSGEPVARILGHKEFWGLPLALSAETLVPRPDTEPAVAYRRSRHRLGRHSLSPALRVAGRTRLRDRCQRGGAANGGSQRR
jgi:methylase of polypeptide subunit release factors